MENLNEMKMDMKELEQVNGGKDDGMNLDLPDCPFPQPDGLPMPRPKPGAYPMPRPKPGK